MRRLLFAAVLLTSASSPAVVFAQSPPGRDAPADTAASDQLFYEGRRLMAQHDYAQACTTFERAEKVRASIGILLNLADCYEQMGRTASALSKFQEGAQAALQASDPRESYARERIAALEPKLVKVTIDVSKLQGVDGVELRLDGTRLDATKWGVALPVDPGPHRVDVQAPNKLRWSSDMAITASTQIVVPSLEHSPVAPMPPPSAESPPAEHPAGLHTRRTWALVAGGVGAAGIGLGTVFGLISISKHADASRHCVGGDNPCEPQGVRSGQDAQSAGDVSTIAFVVGGAALAAGAVLWLTAPRSGTESRGVALVPGVGTRDATLSLGGRW
jgi:hypothetical protein